MKSASNSGDAQWPSRLFDTYDHTGNMAALGALATPATDAELRRQRDTAAWLKRLEPQAFTDALAALSWRPGNRGKPFC